MADFKLVEEAQRPVSMTALQRNNVTISGVGTRALVFVHGLGCDQHMWRLVAPAFEAGYRVVLLDLVGAGQSARTAYDPARYGTLAAHAEDVRAVLHELDLHEVVFVGHSVSAMIGVLAAIQEPARFARLILVAPSPRFLNDGGYVGGFEPADIEELLEAMEHNYLDCLGVAALASVRAGHAGRPEPAADFYRADPAIARHFARVTFLGDNRADLGRVVTPVLLVQSARDALSPLAVGTYLHAQLAGSQLVVLNTCGHCPHLSAPHATIAAIHQFLSPPLPPEP